MFSLMPREKIFFELFNKSAANARMAAEALLDLLTDYTDVPNKIQKLKNLEHAGDEIAHLIFDRLDQTFITPLDREDIHELTSRLDDITDLINAIGVRLALYKIEQPTEDARALARALVQATVSLAEAFALLDQLKRSNEILERCIDVHTQENESDRLYHHALSTLFDGPATPVEIIKWKDLYDKLEAGTDICEDVANVLHAVVIKNT